MADIRVIAGPEDLEEGMVVLSADPILAGAYAQTGPLPLRLRPDGFAGLLHIIVGQQVSTASASAIWTRIEAAGLQDESRVIQATEEDLTNVGLSRPKIRYAKALAEARLDYNGLRGQSDAEVKETLCALKGIGPWTADVYLMFCLGRRDIFAPGDLALQEAARVLYNLPARPSPAELTQMAEAWSPWRSVAARLFWSYYRILKGKEGIR